jgi:DNA-directed RNA polymerase specialized sigma24 family protein
METSGLSKKSRVLLQVIADGRTCEQILANFPAWTYHDISLAAAEALAAANAQPTGKSYELAKVRQEIPRAYEKWDAEEDDRLTRLFHAGKPQEEIARLLQRKQGAIHSRLARLNLVSLAAPQVIAVENKKPASA